MREKKAGWWSGGHQLAGGGVVLAIFLAVLQGGPGTGARRAGSGYLTPVRGQGTSDVLSTEVLRRGPEGSAKVSLHSVPMAAKLTFKGQRENDHLDFNSFMAVGGELPGCRLAQAGTALEGPFCSKGASIN
ncbi:hypothetical protein CCMA1212_000719 [Trichoderma ghanense]|uniref:SSCRP protein n=1 Tax=Trichoderma ghanense TaxID=65468 RepID=A0ABY2HFS9_9HYPO